MTTHQEVLRRLVEAAIPWCLHRDEFDQALAAYRAAETEIMRALEENEKLREGLASALQGIKTHLAICGGGDR